jgi:hypothetical protein
MVDVLEPYVKEIADLKRDLPNILRKILIKKRDDVIRILKEEQLSEGIDSKGKVVGTYSYLTKQYADEELQASGGRTPRKDKTPGQPYNFEWSGGLFDNFYMHFEDKESFSLFSQDEKANFLEKEYGDIFTLTKSNNERINQEILRPEMYDEIIKRLYT